MNDNNVTRHDFIKTAPASGVAAATALSVVAHLEAAVVGPVA